jgi:hypothetical protein
MFFFVRKSDGAAVFLAKLQYPNAIKRCSTLSPKNRSATFEQEQK